MTTNHRHHHPDDHHDDRDPDADRAPADPLRPGHLLCPCGATADRHGLCRKCRARALFDRRTAGRRRTHADRPPTRHRGSRTVAPPATDRPRNRRPGR
jgi:hypothetical protein